MRDRDLGPRAQSLLSLVENTTHDSFELYYGLFLYNPVRRPAPRPAPRVPQTAWRGARGAARAGRPCSRGARTERDARMPCWRARSLWPAPIAAAW